jgi:hypothetical protein
MVPDGTNYYIKLALVLDGLQHSTDGFAVSRRTVGKSINIALYKS